VSARRLERSSLLFVGVAVAILTAPTPSVAAEAPIKEVLASHIGREVDLTQVNAKAGLALEDLCTVESKDECQPATESSEPGGFAQSGPGSVAVDTAPASPLHGDVYVTDDRNHRVQVVTPGGAFVLMFGWDVNKTKVESAASRAERDLCTAASKDVCQAGVGGSAPGQFERPQDVSVDPVSGHVYVASSERVQELTGEGTFVLEIGKPGEIQLNSANGNLLAVGGPEDLLYVGERSRVQEFKANGTVAGEITLPSSPAGREAPFTTALTLDPTGNVYLLYGPGAGASDVIREFSSSGSELRSFALAVGVVKALAIDSAGRLAVYEFESLVGGDRLRRGSLYAVGASGLHLISEFATEFPTNEADIAFGEGGELYASSGNEVISYLPLPVAELTAGAPSCQTGAPSEAGATVDCTLRGEANPFGVAETSVFFRWGRGSALGSLTPEQPVATGSVPVPVSAPVAGLLPNETYAEQLGGYDHNVQPPESALTSEPASFSTPAVPASILGEPSAQFVHASSAVLFGELNPQNASTRYEFQYGPCGAEGCVASAYPNASPAAQSSTYGAIGTTMEITGLEPATVYHYRLFAEDEAKSGSEKFVSEGPEGSFTTGAQPAPSAITGPPSAVGITSAIVSGTVDADGPQATYSFELGVYEGSATHFGVVSSGAVPAGTAPVSESHQLTGLQPGTTYAYRIAIKSGYIEGSGVIEGEAVTFTTAGLPSVLSVSAPLALLATPNIAFPTPVTSRSTTKAVTSAQKLAKALKACKKQRSKRQRAVCETQARKRYGKSKQANRRKKG
jgi:hypothetical protein